MYFVYILLCLKRGETYVGHTDDLLRRYRMHRYGTTRHTRERLEDPVVVHWEGFPARTEAVRRERYFKQGSGHRVKQELVSVGRAWFEHDAAG